MTTTKQSDRKRGDRPFPWMCPVCMKHEVHPSHISYTAEIKHDGLLHTVHLPALELPKCRSCGELLFDYRADDQIHDALRAQLHLLTPAQIRNRRKDLGL